MHEMIGRTVAVLGASDNPERYAFKAAARLAEKGFRVIPVNPARAAALGPDARNSLSEITEAVDTLTIYVGPARSSAAAPEIVALKPSRVVLNPGTENPELEVMLEAAGIPWLHACTLVLLATDRF